MKKLDKHEERPGYYFDLTRGEFLKLDVEGLILAQAQGKVVKVPAMAVILAGPLVGLAYVIFLPFAGIMAAFAWAGMKVRNLAAAVAEHGHERVRG